MKIRPRTVNAFWHKEIRISLSVILLIYLYLLASDCSAELNDASLFIIAPQDATVIAGHNITLRCQVREKKGPLQWTRDGFGLGLDRDLHGYTRYKITGSENLGEYNLHISHAELEDDAKYQCQMGASSHFLGARTNDAVLLVLVAPEAPILIDGPQKNVIAGFTVDLACRSNGGRPVAEIRWYSSDSKIPLENDNIKIEIEKIGKQDNIVSTLTLAINKEHNGKKFICEVTHPSLNEPLTSSVTLNVQYPPEVTLVVSPNSLSENMKVEFRCTAVGNPNQLTYKWYRNGAIITGIETTKYVISNIGRNYNGDNIDCEVSNSVGAGRSSVTLNVRYGPRFAAPPQNIAADAGDTVTMTCMVDGNPPPTIIWTRKGSLRVLSTGNSLSIAKTQDIDFTSYLCTSTVSGFPEITGEVKLFKKGPPKITSPANLLATQGKTAMVECRIESVPPPDSIIWMKNSEILDVGNIQRYQVEQETLENGIRSILKIIDVYEGDLGLYNCSAWNSYGSDAKAIALRVEAPLPLHFLLGGIIGGVVIITIIIVVIVLYLKKRRTTKRNDKDDKDDSDVDVKVEYKTNVDPEADGEWVGEHRDVPNGDLYRYSADYAEPLYNLPKDMHNDNGYIPYVDYHHDYNPDARDFTTTFGHPNSHSPVYMYRQESTYVPPGSLSDHGSCHSDYSRPPSGRMATHV